MESTINALRGNYNKPGLQRRHPVYRIACFEGVPVFAYTLNKFPDLMASALSKQEITQWAAKEDLVLKK